MAEAVNAYLYEHAGRRFAVHARYIGTLERGTTRWPSAHYRTGLRAVLGKATDAELGFFIIQGHAKDPDGIRVEPARSTGPSDAAPADLRATVPVATRRGIASPREAGGGLRVVPAVAAAVQVSVNAGAAVRLMCHDGRPGCVAVMAGPLRVLIDVSDVDSVSAASSGNASVMLGAVAP
ncbi:hypothetical protein [Micromonospora inyonensis]|uniref:hypothetical protein n=1 Tax=Micromonospora inyonensis TaxID=47866 RepID=UPI00114CB815|nr:hypothetical protein [Micromonospora inyonensis]